MWLQKKGKRTDKLFTIECYVDGIAKPIVAKGRSKRNAEQTAAKMALQMIALDVEQD